MLRNHTGWRKWPLRGDAGDNPAFTHNTTIQFDLKNLPLWTSNLANYLAAIQLTFAGNYNIVATSGNITPLTPNEQTRCLIDSIDLQGAWHGRPLAQQHVRGATLPIIEHISCGHQWGSRHRMPMQAAAVGAQSFYHTVTLPLAYFLGEKGHHTAQLALFYKDAQLMINTAALSILQAINPNAVFSGVTVRASALLLAEPELRIGPAQEWLEFRQTAQANNDTVDLDSLGNMTALEGVEPGAGLDTILALTSVCGQLGSFEAGTVTRFSCPFRDQTQTNHVQPFIHEWEQQASIEGADEMVRNSETAAQARTGFVDPRASMPYEPLSGATANVLGGTAINNNARAFPILVGSRNLETSKLQVIEGTNTYYLTATFTGSHRTLIHQFKSWTPQKLADARAIILDSGLADRVVGTRQLQWSAKAINKNADAVDGRKARFFPLRLRPMARSA
jgi:hypothetical protein